ncbi:hypothetical protein [Microcoleus sp. herbarium19]
MQCEYLLACYQKEENLSLVPGIDSNQLAERYWDVTYLDTKPQNN